MLSTFKFNGRSTHFWKPSPAGYKQMGQGGYKYETRPVGTGPRKGRTPDEVAIGPYLRDTVQYRGSLKKQLGTVNLCPKFRTSKATGLVGKVLTAPFGIIDEIYSDIDELRRACRTLNCNSTEYPPKRSCRGLSFSNLRSTRGVWRKINFGHQISE